MVNRTEFDILKDMYANISAQLQVFTDVDQS
jgi:hypothetical protein